MTDTKKRASLGFADAMDDFDPSEWQAPNPSSAKPKQKPRPQDAAKVAEVSGFTSREPTSKKLHGQRRHTTGRNRQMNLKATAETIETFGKVADANGWSLAETLEEAVSLLAAKHLK